MTSVRTRAVAVAAAVSLTFAALPSPAFAAPGAAADNADLIAVSADGGTLSLRFRDDRTARADRAGVDPARIELGPAGGLTGRVPDDPAFAFLGKAGRPVWSLSAGGGRFPALDTTGIGRGKVRGDAVTLRLTSVDGPGEFAAYTVSPWGRPRVLLDSDAHTSTRLPVGERIDNVAWTFDQGGDYRLNFAASAVAGGRTIEEKVVYRVAVPPMAAAVGQEAPEKQQAQQNARVISDGHVDMGPQLDGGAWRIRLKDDTAGTPVWRELSDVVLKVTGKARIPVPAGDGYGFLGRTGDPIWMLPQTQQAGIVWPGWNTQHASVVAGVSGAVSFALTGVDGPGQFKLFLTGTFGKPQVLFDSARALPQQITVPLNSHAHGNWAFTKPGRYRLTVRMDAKTKAGKAVTDTRTLTLAVGDGTAVEAGGAPGATQGATTGGAQGGGGGPLARTGTDVITIAVAGLVLAALGTAAAVLGRRRRTT